MEKEKLIPISIMMLAASILISSIIIYKGLLVSSNIASGSVSGSISSSMNSMANTINSYYSSLRTQESSDILTVQEAADYLHIPSSELVNALDNKDFDIPYASINYRYVFSKNALAKWLETRHVTTEEQ